MKFIFIIICIFSNAYARQSDNFNFSDEKYLAGIKKNDCYDEDNARTHLSTDCELLYGEFNKCNSGTIVFRDTDYAVCKKYISKKEKRDPGIK